MNSEARWLLDHHLKFMELQGMLFIAIYTGKWRLTIVDYTEKPFSVASHITPNNYRGLRFLTDEEAEKRMIERGLFDSDWRYIALRDYLQRKYPPSLVRL